MKASKIYGFLVLSLLIGVILLPIFTVRACHNDKRMPRERDKWWRWRHHDNPTEDPPEELPEDPPDEPPEDPPEEPPEGSISITSGYSVTIYYDFEYVVGAWFMPPNEYVVISLRDAEYNGTNYELLVTIVDNDNKTTMSKSFEPRIGSNCLVMYIGALRFSQGINTLTVTLDGTIIHTRNIMK